MQLGQEMLVEKMRECAAQRVITKRQKVGVDVEDPGALSHEWAMTKPM